MVPTPSTLEKFPALRRRGNIVLRAIFRHGATSDEDLLRTQPCGDFLVFKRFPRILRRYQLSNHFAHREG